MHKKSAKTSWLMGVAGAALCFGIAPAHAQQTAQTVQGSQPGGPPAEITTADQVVIIGEIAYRNRSEETAPVLEYGLDYFQRFEPLTVGDALKRVPSVTFLSDVLESDGVRLRGLDPAYTQILINGEKVPGAGADSGAFGNGSDGAFFVDRIPAELIERIELVRSASANRSGDAMAGAVNIVLRDGYSLDGGYVRLGALGFDDGRIRETYGAVWGGEVGGGRLLLGANVQGRRNPKEKFSARYTAPGGALVNIEDQSDVRDGTDYSGNFAYQIDAGTGEFKIDGFYVKTERTADEDSFEFLTLPPPPAATVISALNRSNTNLFTINDNDVDTEQDSWGLNAGYEFEGFGGETLFKLGYAKFEQSEDEFENEVEYLRGGAELVGNPPANRQYPEADRFTRDLVRADVDDTEFKAKIEHSREMSFGELEIGLQYETKERDNFNGEGRFRITPSAAISGLNLADASGAGVPGLVEPTITANDGGDNTIERTQIAPFVMVSGETGAFAWEAGLRYEAMKVEIEDRTTATTDENEYGMILPSAHLKWSVSENGRISLSGARTVRNPSFNFLSPAELSEELGDNDFRGNPRLEPETAWGLDAGYEHQIGRDGIVGVNVFYRSVEDLIEIFATSERGSACPATDPPGTPCLARKYEPRNTGDGTVYGVEFDASFPLSFIGLPDTGVFANYSWLDSEIDDEFGSRRFQSQSDYIYNLGFIHDLQAWGAAFGVTYRKQGDAFSRVVGEEVTTSYEGVLEAFVEKQIGDRFTIRLTGSNLLDGSKDETFDKFASRANQIARIYTGGEFEIESETAGPTWQLIGRYAF